MVVPFAAAVALAARWPQAFIARPAGHSPLSDLQTDAAREAHFLSGPQWAHRLAPAEKEDRVSKRAVGDLCSVFRTVSLPRRTYEP